MDKKDFVTKVQKPLVQAVLDRFDQRMQVDPLLVNLARLFSVTSLPQHPEEVKTDLKAVHARFESLLNCDLKTLEMQYGTFITVAGMEKSKKPDITPAALLKAWLTGPFAQVFKPINALVLIILSIPVASAEAERVFSAMKRIKTDKRVSMSPTMLEDLMWISLNGPPPDQFNYKLAVLAWYGQRKRRMQFTPNYVMQMLKELGWVTMKPVPETCE